MPIADHLRAGTSSAGRQASSSKNARRCQLFYQVFTALGSENITSKKFDQKSDTAFYSTATHAMEWKRLCGSQCKQLLVAVFDPAKATKVSCDA